MWVSGYRRISSSLRAWNRSWSRSGSGRTGLSAVGPSLSLSVEMGGGRWAGV